MRSNSFSLSGVFTALVTPFTADGTGIDYDSFARLVDFQLAAGVSGVVVCGSTGEASTLSDVEYRSAVAFVVERVRSKVPCVSGISVSSTARALELATYAREVGCDAVLVATPPYNKPSQDGLLAHFREIRRACELPVIAYNVPSRSGASIATSTLGVLSREGTIVGVKESSGSLEVVIDTLRAVGPACSVVSGEDSLVLAVLAYGGTGVISASANILPKEFVALHAAYSRGANEEAREIQMAMMPKIRAVFVESNPVPVKFALSRRGILSHPAVRLPLAPLSPASVEVVHLAFG